ncbi:MAG TPA: serine/threonine-protein kinase [Kofleriaceae bacterium]
MEDEDEDGVRAARPEAPADVPLARARFFAAVFGADAGEAGFGRFALRRRRGRGGMGVVYEAHDPELQRDVALKLIHVSSDGRSRALAEAQALARLSHPNVVPIYDVGVEREHVYLVMELVRGMTLAEWRDGRTMREILAAYAQAGAALEAAHVAGLVHRDFKPANAIMGTDARVRVVDFGLACEADDAAPRAAAGTPRFMAPEIAAGEAVTPAADQYSFAVALADALGAAPPPRRIAAALDRARDPDPAARFPSMRELLGELARDPGRTRRRAAVLVVGAAAIGALAYGFGHRTLDVPCSDGTDELGRVWSGAARTASLERIDGLGPYGRLVRAQIAPELDRFANAWQRSTRAACIEHRRGGTSDRAFDATLACLRRGVDAFGTVRRLVDDAGQSQLAQLPLASQALPDPAACDGRVRAASEIEPPATGIAQAVGAAESHVTRARVLVGAGRYAEARAESEAAIGAARELGYPPLLTEALLVAGHAQMNLVDAAAAAPLLREATYAAITAHADAFAVEAWARLAYVEVRTLGGATAIADRALIEAIARRAPDGAFARALLLNNLGTAELANDELPAARVDFERALEASRGVDGEGALELVAIRSNLALTTTDPVASDAILRAAVAELTARLGAEHPMTLAMRQQHAFVALLDARATADALAPICAAYDLHPAESASACWLELGLVREDLGDRPGALAALLRAAAAPDPEPEAAATLTRVLGDPRGASRQFSAELAAMPAPNPGEVWPRLVRARLSLGLGLALVAAGDRVRARAALGSAIDTLAPYVSARVAARYTRRLARARAELAALAPTTR